MCEYLFDVNVENETYNVRKDIFHGDLKYIGYRRCARILENYYIVTQDESRNMLGRERSFFTNIFPIPYIIEGGEPEWFYERTGINHNDYIHHAFGIRTKIFIEAIKLYQPKALIIFASKRKDAFVKEIFEKYLSSFFVDETSKSWILPPIINPYHPGQNLTRVSEDDWVNGISEYLKMISNRGL